MKLDVTPQEFRMIVAAIELANESLRTRYPGPMTEAAIGTADQLLAKLRTQDVMQRASEQAKEET